MVIAVGKQGDANEMKTWYFDDQTIGLNRSEIVKKNQHPLRWGVWSPVAAFLYVFPIPQIVPERTLTGFRKLGGVGNRGFYL